MKESVRLEYSELPREVDLKTAFELNQRLWRQRDNFLSVSSPVEVPEKLVGNVFDMVQEKFDSYIPDDFHRTERPLVGYSLLPEIPILLNAGYYRADFGGNCRMALFEEFATDWLANVVFGTPPYEMNAYGRKVDARIGGRKHPPFNFEDELLATIVNGFKERKLSEEDITHLFAGILIGGSENITNRPGTSTSVVGESLETVDLELDGAMSLFLLKSGLFIKVSEHQFQKARAGLVGSVSFPGVINLSGLKPRPNYLAHEYIHFLSFHEKCKGGVPITGYKLIGVNIT